MQLCPVHSSKKFSVLKLFDSRIKFIHMNYMKDFKRIFYFGPQKRIDITTLL